MLCTKMSTCTHPAGNVLITKDHFILAKRNFLKQMTMPQIPGCICARYFYNSSPFITIYAVVHEGNTTKIIMGIENHQEFKFRTLLIKDELIDIINISEYHLPNDKIYLFSTSEGVLFTFNAEGKSKDLPSHIPKDTVGLVGNYSIRHDGTISDVRGSDCDIGAIVGYKSDDFTNKTLWSDNKIFNLSDAMVLERMLKHHSTIEDVFIIHNDDDDKKIIMILSERIIHVRWIDEEGNIEFSEEFLGEWSYAPCCISTSIYAVDNNGVLRDIRCAWINYKKSNVLPHLWNNIDVDPDMLYSSELSLFEKGEEKRRHDMIFHGMIVFTRKRIKNAFSTLE